MLIIAMMIAPVLVWGQDKTKTISFFKALAVPPKKTACLNSLYRNNDLCADPSNPVIEAEMDKEEKMWGFFLGHHLYKSGRILCGNKNSFKL